MTMVEPPPNQTAIERWYAAAKQLGPRARVHAGSEVSRCYRELARIYPNVEILGFASGSRSGSWQAPPAWEVEHAYLRDPDGQVIADWAVNPLSLYTYSPPVSGSYSRQALEPHLFSLQTDPDVTPYHFRNQYRHWEPEWGFCLPHRVRQALPDGDYQVDIATRFAPGCMEMAEQVHQGERTDSLLLIGHFDHPYMFNDGLMGCLAGHEAITRLAGRRTKLTYRMLSTIEIIGSVFYAEHHAHANNVREGLFVAASGAVADISYATSFLDEAAIDRAIAHILREKTPRPEIFPFRRGDLGNDEVAFDVAGVGIPCGSLMRAPIPSYHTERDDISKVDAEKFEEIVEILLRAINILECNAYLAAKFTGLPCLSHPDLGLYISPAEMSGSIQGLDPMLQRLVAGLGETERRALDGKRDDMVHMMTVLPIMCGGRHTVLDVAELCNLPFEVVDVYSDLWQENGLLTKTWADPFAAADHTSLGDA